MRTALYRSRSARRCYSQLRLHRFERRTGIAQSISSPCARVLRRRGTHSGMHPGAHERTLRGLLIKAVEGGMGLLGVQRGHPALLPPGHVRQHYRLHEAASWRGQRPVQGAIAFIASPAGD